MSQETVVLRRICSLASPNGKDAEPDRSGGGRHDLRDTGQFRSAMVSGSEYPRLTCAPETTALRKNNPGYLPGAVYLSARSNSYRCPAGEQLELRRLERSQSCPCLYRQRQTLRSMPAKNRMHEWTVITYPCAIHIHELRPTDVPRELVNTPAFAQAQRQRKKVEALFAELSNQHRPLRRLRFTAQKFVSRAVLPASGGPEYQADGRVSSANQQNR